MKNKYIFYIIILFGFIVLLNGCTIKQLFCKHQYEENIIESTCTTFGKIEHICKKCDKKTFDVILKKEHTYGDYKITKEPSCVSEGEQEAICLYCGIKSTQIVEKSDHKKIETIILPSCTEKGYTLVSCENCNYQNKINYVDKLGHKFDNWEVMITPTEICDGLDIRHCLNCEYFEKKIISSLNYIDLDIIKLDYEESINNINSLDDLVLLFDYVVLNEISSFEVELSFKENNLLSYLVNNCSIDSFFKVEVNQLNNLYKFNFEYESKPINKVDESDDYIQYDSLNKTIYQSNRSKDFDDFKINNSIYEFNVSTSEQLFYCLERRTKPIALEDSMAEVILNTAKSILREIIDDDMNDFEKIKAIHDWLVLNVTYDDELLNLATNTSIVLANYRGFYLEGVFIDKKAVCEGISKAFCVLANIEGIPCVQVDGYQTLNPGGVKHAWNKVYLDGDWYVIDVTSDGVILNDSFEILTYDYFLITNEQMKLKYTEEEFTNIICDKSYLVFDKLSYIYLDEMNSCLINNFDEFKNVVAYLESIDLQNFSIQILLNFDFGSSINDELQIIYTMLNIQNGSSYLLDGKKITLLK